MLLPWRLLRWLLIDFEKKWNNKYAYCSKILAQELGGTYQVL